MSKKVDFNEIMDGVAAYVATINGLKMGLINEGWDPTNAEDVVAAQLSLEAKSKCRICGHDPKEQQ